MFEDLISTLEAHSFGVRGYEQVAQLCYKSVAEQPNYAVYFLVLSFFAERFVNQYDDYPLTVDEVDIQKKRILDWIDKLEESLKKNQAEQIELLNSVSRDFLYI